jgi:hypothetical protein
MKETGIVTDLKGEVAVVKVEREIIDPEDCCGRKTTLKSFFLETRNLCQAKIGDQVWVESDDDTAKSRNLIQICISVAVFVVGLGAADAALPLLGISRYLEPLSLAAGVIIASGAFGLMKLIDKRNSRNIPASYELA